MKSHKIAFIIICHLLIYWPLQSQQRASNQARPYVVVLSLDGFRWDYTQGIETPNFDRIAHMGTKATSLQPSFPSKTFPNHYTIATGMYPGHHGLVNNSFHDPILDITYKISDRSTVENKAFYGGEPIWNTAEKQGIKAACFYWVGSEAPVQDMRPSIWKKYDHHFPWNARIDTVISWLSLPEPERPHLLMWYLPEPDGVGHKHGPQSQEVRDMIIKLDQFIGHFLDQLEKLPHYAQINMIITSDHGMGATSSERYVGLNEYIKKKDLEYIIEGNPVVFIQPKTHKLEKVYNKLKNINHLHVSKNLQRPPHWHYNNIDRVADLVVVADSSWSIGWDQSVQSWSGGAHGYDPTNKDMHAIFYAFGPAFKKAHIHPTFENVDIYQLITKILSIKPAPNDGKFERIEDMLNSNKN